MTEIHTRPIHGVWAEKGGLVAYQSSFGLTLNILLLIGQRKASVSVWHFWFVVLSSSWLGCQRRADDTGLTQEKCSCQQPTV